MRKRLPLLLPLIMLALAALACDGPGPNYQPLRITRLEADRSAPGKAYILVEGYREKFASSSATKLSKVYETDSYGERWQPSTRSASELPESPKDNLRLQASGERLYIQSREIWRFPREMFRLFFTETNDEFYAYLSTTSTSAANSVSPADPDVIWVIIPEQGVLVGPNPDRPTATRAWRLTNTGIDLLQPAPLTLKNPLVVLFVVLAALIVPPLSLLHAYVMRRVYRHAVEPAEEGIARRWAAIVSGIIAAVAAVAIVIWLVEERIDYYEMTVPMAILAAVISTGATILLARRSGKSGWFTIKLAVAAALASLVIPAGVVWLPFSWFVVMPMLVCYEAGVRLINIYQRRRNSPIPRWQCDLLALGFMIVAGVLLGIAVAFPPIVLIYLVIMVIAPLVLRYGLRRYLDNVADVIVHLIGAEFGSIVAAAAVFFAQAMVRQLFITLARG